jgi:dienelactone hydrolase
MTRRWIFSLCVTACGPAGDAELPGPTGPHAIARLTVRWVDDARPEPITDDPNDRREVTVHLWYPAAATEQPPAAYVPDLAVLRSVLDARTIEAYEHTHLHAVDAVAPADAPVSFPLVVLSHGDDMLSAQYGFLAEELVSHGYAVAAIDHPYDARAVALSDGRVVAFADDLWPELPPPDPSGKPDPDSEHARWYRARVDARAADVRFLLDRLAALDLAEAGGSIAARLDLDRVGYVGHSVGGVAAGELCRTDARLRACVNLDGDSGLGPFYLDPGDDDGIAFAQPYMMLTKPFAVPDAQLAAWGLTRETWSKNLQAERDRFFGSVAGGSYRVELDGASHSSFSDDPFVFAALAGDPTGAHLRRLQLIRRCALELFGMALRGEPAPLLAGDADEPGLAIARWPAHG